MLDQVTLFNRHACTLKLGGHGWVDIGIRACHAVTKLTREQRQRAHKRPTNTKNMNMHSCLTPLKNKEYQSLYSSAHAHTPKIKYAGGICLGVWYCKVKKRH